MRIKSLSNTTSLLYSELLQQLIDTVSILDKKGSFVSKTIGDTKYWYLQSSILGRKCQTYLGKDAPKLADEIKRVKKRWDEAKPLVQRRSELVAMLRQGGAAVPTRGEAKVLDVLNTMGVFENGGVLVGSQAFATYGNMLGLKWPNESTRTSDSDIADDAIRVGVPANSQPDPRLIGTDLEFIQILDLKNRVLPSFRIKDLDLTVEFLTPLIGPKRQPVLMKNLNMNATGLRFLEYLLHDTEPAAIIAKSGILVHVPNPARFAIHKLVVAQRRGAFQQLKSRKDIQQSSLLLDELMEHRPGDLVLAHEAALKMPKKFMSQYFAGITQLPEHTIQAWKNMLA